MFIEIVYVGIISLVLFAVRRLMEIFFVVNINRYFLKWIVFFIFKFFVVFVFVKLDLGKR